MKKYMKSLIILCGAILMGLSICASSAFAVNYCWRFYPYPIPLTRNQNVSWGTVRTTYPLTLLSEGLYSADRLAWEDGPYTTFYGSCYDRQISADGWYDINFPCPPYNPPVTSSTADFYTPPCP
jgi:hypothetical protein